MGGSGGGRRSHAPTFTPRADSPTPSELVDQEITKTQAEGRRVTELLDAVKNAEKDDFVLCALNAGQGDCCVMRLPDGKVVVVDCNVTSANVNVAKFLEQAGVREIDLLILTHPDRDHVSGLPALAKAVTIRNVIDGRFRKEGEDGSRTPGYAEYRQAIEDLKRSGTNFQDRTAIRGDVGQVGSVSVEFLAPHAPMQAEDANQASLCFKVRSGQRTVLFGGDVTKETWDGIVARDRSKLKSDVFWSSHHGAESGCHPDAVRAIRPTLTVVSVGENEYGHPHEEAMSC